MKNVEENGLESNSNHRKIRTVNEEGDTGSTTIESKVFVEFNINNGSKTEHCGQKCVSRTDNTDNSVGYPAEITIEDNVQIGNDVDDAILIDNDVMSCGVLNGGETNSSLNSMNNLTSTLFDRRTLQFLIHALGICCSYFVSGFFSEKLLRGSFGPLSETFSFIYVFVFIQNLVNHIYAEVLLCTLFKQEEEDKTETKYYAMASLTNCGSMYLASKSLTWINYPTQVLGKSAKPIPVMIFNVLIGKQRYTLKKYCFVTLVVAGVSIFVFMNKSDQHKVQNLHFNLGWGELCVAVSLLLDGITGAFQERMRQDYQTKPGHFMSNLNKWSMLYVGIGMILSREALDCYKFLLAYPTARYYLFAITICSALGQTFIFLMLSHFGSLSCTLVTTLRKFFTILGSIILFGHSMVPLQWLATLLVFSGLLLDTYFSNRDHRAKRASPL